MTISELIKKLETLRQEHGDVPVKTQTLSHLWNPEPEVRDRDDAKFILLNP